MLTKIEYISKSKNPGQFTLRTYLILKASLCWDKIGATRGHYSMKISIKLNEFRKPYFINILLLWKIIIASLPQVSLLLRNKIHHHRLVVCMCVHLHPHATKYTTFSKINQSTYFRWSIIQGNMIIFPLQNLASHTTDQCSAEYSKGSFYKSPSV